MAATRSRLGLALALTVLFVGFHAVLIAAVVVLTQSAESPPQPSRPPVAVASARPADTAPPPPAREADALRDAPGVLRQAISQTIGQNAGGSRRIIIRPEVMAARPQVVARLLHQMLQVEPVSLRTTLLTQLKQLRNPASSRAL